MAGLRKNLVWILVGLAVVAVPAIVGIVLVSDGGDRRLAAAASGELGQIVGARLVLEESDYGIWRKLNWGIDLDVIEQKSTDAEGNPVVKLVAGASKNRALALERGLTVGGNTNDFIAAVKAGQVYRSATVSLLASDGTVIATYELAGVLIGSVEHEIAAGATPLERLALRYESVSFSG